MEQSSRQDCLLHEGTVKPLLTHASQSLAQAMSYGLQGLNFEVKLTFFAAKKYGVWVTRAMG